ECDKVTGGQVQETTRIGPPAHSASATPSRASIPVTLSPAHALTPSSSRPLALSRRHPKTETRLAWALVLPALGTIAVIALFPLLWAIWESLHLHDLRMPWRGRPFVGLANYTEALGSSRFWQALGHTTVFTV